MIDNKDVFGGSSKDESLCSCFNVVRDFGSEKKPLQGTIM